MTSSFVVTEGKSDVLLLQGILGISAGSNEVKCVAAGGWSAADSLARSLLVRGNDNVALVVDADASSPDSIEERRRFLHRSLGEIRDETKWRVFVIAPEIEALFFEDRTILESLVGHGVEQRDLDRAEFEPKAVLTKLLDGTSLISALEEHLPMLNLLPLRDNKAMADLYGFVMGRSGITNGAGRSKALR